MPPPTSVLRLLQHGEESAPLAHIWGGEPPVKVRAPVAAARAPEERLDSGGNELGRQALGREQGHRGPGELRTFQDKPVTGEENVSANGLSLKYQVAVSAIRKAGHFTDGSGRRSVRRRRHRPVSHLECQAVR